jgi:transposase
MERRQRRAFTDDYKRQAADLGASSGRSVGSVAKELGLRDSVLRRWVERRGAGREPSADHAAEIARLQRENERLRMERDILKNCPAPWRACAGQKQPCAIVCGWRVAAARLLEAQSPLKNMVHGCMRT